MGSAFDLVLFCHKTILYNIWDNEFLRFSGPQPTMKLMMDQFRNVRFTLRNIIYQVFAKSNYMRHGSKRNVTIPKADKPRHILRHLMCPYSAHICKVKISFAQGIDTGAVFRPCRPYGNSDPCYIKPKLFDGLCLWNCWQKENHEHHSQVPGTSLHPVDLEALPRQEWQQRLTCLMST